MSKIAFFIDGFNFYHILDKKIEYHKYKWLDFEELFKLKYPKCEYEIHYFTAINYPEVKISPRKYKPKKQRHMNYIKILESKGINIHYGNFKRKDWKCIHCNKLNETREEKQTDVSVAVEILMSLEKNFDKYVLVSADTDYIPVLKALRERVKPRKKIDLLILFEYMSDSIGNKLFDYADGRQIIFEKDLESSRLPSSITLNDGTIINCPDSWK